ncbi:MAG: dihydrofolate reductase family protein, partial [Thermodesulfovibrionales bacterium]|nr:dihydrofolate reductase family protein [Thermodesulfovibrionales bacterium]
IIEYDGERVDMKWLMKKLGEMGIASVLIEGGSSLNSHALEYGIVDKVMFFIAPKIIGGKESFPSVGGKAVRKLSEAHQLKNITLKRIGDDILLEGYIK